MDLNVLRSILTLLLFVGFCTMMILVILRGSDAYKQAANLPFADDEGNKSDE